MICRFGVVRIFQIPGSRLRMRAAPSNAWSIAPKSLRSDISVAMISVVGLFSFQLSAFSFQLSAFSSQLSAFGSRLSALGSQQLSAISYQLRKNKRSNVALSRALCQIVISYMRGTH